MEVNIPSQLTTMHVLYILMTVIKGKVVLIDEQNAMLEYVVQVVKIIKQGNKMLKDGGLIGLWKRGACQSPDLKENKEYLFMGRDEGERYELDKTSFVKLWPQNKDNKDKTTLDDFAAQLACWIEAEHCRQPTWQALK